jgi:peroxiredoxin
MVLASNLIAIPRHPEFNTVEKKSCSAGFGRARLLETLEKWERWEDLVAVADSVWIAPGQGEPEVARLRSLAAAHFELGQTERLAAVVGNLEEEAARVPPEAQEKPKAKEPAQEAEKPKAEEKPGTKPVERALAEAKALEGVLEGAPDAAERLAAVESHLAPVRLARAWLRLGNQDKAAAAAAKAGQDLAGQAAKVEILLACGKEAEAKTAFASAKPLAFALDPDLPVAARLREWAARWQPGEPWPPAAPVRTDVGERPPLESLGPALWTPPPVPAWEATALDGTRVGGKTLAGKPHVLLFYLGAGCSHCVEQLQAFGALAGDFSGAGIGLTAITTESPGDAVQIRDRLSGASPDGLPFPVWCDPGGQAFRAFRAYDDFERDALHATVFVDGAGRVRWIDAGWKPFTDARFLLAEAKRLLALPAGTGEGHAVPEP